MTLKVIKIGNSAGIILPQIIRQENDIHIGDDLEFRQEAKGILIKKVKKQKKNTPVTIKFAQMVDEFMTQHEDVLQELANR